MSSELNGMMRELYDNTGERNPRTAASKLLDEIPPADRDKILRFLLTQHYSSFLSGLRRAGGKHLRRTPAVNPAAQTGRALDELDSRPIYVPLLGKRITWGEMTRDYWESFNAYRWGRAAGYQATAEWGERNLAALETSHVTRSGDLPILVKRELFDIQPDDPEE